MALNTPTIRQLVTQAEAEINALIPNADARLKFSVLNVFARVWAALVDGLYGVLIFLSKQLFAKTATREYLELIAESYGIYRRLATASTGQVKISGVNGASVILGTIFSRADGVQYKATSSGIIGLSGYILIDVVAMTTGANTNAASQTKLNSSTPIAGATDIEVSNAAIGGGTDDETDESLRSRLQFKLQNPAGAGTVTDWERWTREFSSSVTRVWVIPVVQGSGTVGIVFAQDDLGVVPVPSQVTAMQAHLEQYVPVGSAVYAYAPTLKVVNFTIAEQPSGQPAVQSAITEQLIDLLFRESYPASQLTISHINEAISSATGEVDHVLASPVSSVTFGAVAPVFEIGSLGVITWQ